MPQAAKLNVSSHRSHASPRSFAPGRPLEHLRGDHLFTGGSVVTRLRATDGPNQAGLFVVAQRVSGDTVGGGDLANGECF